MWAYLKQIWIIGDTQQKIMAMGWNNWSLGNSGLGHLYGSEILWSMLTSLLQLWSPRPPQGFLRGRWAFSEEGGCPSLLKFSATFHFPLPFKFEQPSCQYDYPARCIWLTCSSLHNGPESVTLRLSLPLALWCMGPDSKCHVTSPHGIKAPLRAGNPNRWLKCLQKDSSRHPGRCTEPCQWWRVARYAQQKMPKGGGGSHTHRDQRMLVQTLGRSSLSTPFAFAKYLLTPWSQCFLGLLMALEGNEGKLFIYMKYFIKKQTNGER